MTPNLSENLTDADVSVLSRRLALQRLNEWALPQPPPLTGLELEQCKARERKVQERAVAAKAEEERLRAQRVVEAERRRSEWEANAPKRAKAAAELAELEPELEALERRLEELRDRHFTLEREATK